MSKDSQLTLTIHVSRLTENKHDQNFKKKTFTNLDSLGSAASGGDHCGLYGSAKEGDTRVIAATSKDTSVFEKIK